MKPIEVIEKEVPGMIGTKNNQVDATVNIVAELFGEKIFNGEEQVFARLNFMNKETNHLIGQIYLKGVRDKEKLQEAVDGAADKINEILPCL